MAAEAEYLVRFDDDPTIISPDPDEPGIGFDWAEGGKMPGLRGGIPGIEIGGGTFSPDGVKTLLMWQKPPESNPDVSGLIVYVYWQGQQFQPANTGSNARNYGDAVRVGVNMVRGRWYHIRQRVVMNTPGQNDGKLQMWVDGVPRVDQSYMWRRAGATWGIHGLLVSMFHGGNAEKHIANRISKMDIDNVKLSRTP